MKSLKIGIRIKAHWTGFKKRPLVKKIYSFLLSFFPGSFAENVLQVKLKSKPDFWPSNNISLINEIEKRLNTYDSTDIGNRYLHHRWVHIFETTMQDIKDFGLPLPEDFNYLCLGAGHRNPFAYPFLFHLLGAGHTHIVEPYEQFHNDSVFYGLHSIMERTALGDITSKFIDIKNISCRRLQSFINPDAFFARDDIYNILNKEKVSFHNNYFENTYIPDNSIDFMTSRSVLEHIIEYEDCFDGFARVMKSGGQMYHEIGLGAHSLLDPFMFYYKKNKKGAPKNRSLNELRLSDYLNHIEKRGFSCRVIRKDILDKYPLKRNRIVKKFRRYGDEDLLCENAIILCIKK